MFLSAFFGWTLMHFTLTRANGLLLTIPVVVVKGQLIDEGLDSPSFGSN